MFNWEIFFSFIGIFAVIGVIIFLAIVTISLFEMDHYLFGWATIIIMLIGAAAIGGFIG